MKKRMLALLMAFVMVLGMLPSMGMTAEADWDIDDCEVGGILYSLNTTTKTAALACVLDDTLTELDVSTVEYEGVVYTVTDALDSVACEGPLISINLPNVTTLDGATFAFLYDLTSVSLPKVITVGSLAFSECTSLESIALPEATSIAQSAFEGCVALKSVSLPKVTSIEVMAFSMTALATLDLPEVTSIGNGAFQGNVSLASVSFPKVITIGNKAFKNCESLSSITIPACTTSVGTQAFQGCDRLTSVVVTSKDTSIDAAAFTGVGKSGTTASLTLPSDWPETDRPDASGNWKGGKFGTVTYTGGTPVTHGGECFLYDEDETILCGVHGAVHVGDVLSAGMGLSPNGIMNYLNETLVQEVALLYADATVTEVSGLVIKLENDMSTANPYAALKADAENYACGVLRLEAEIVASGIEAILQALPLDDLAYVGGGEDGEWTISMLDGSHYDVIFSEEHDFVEGVCDRCGASQGGGGTVTVTMADLINAITGKKCVDIVDAGGILCASGYDNVVEVFQNNSSTFENVKKVSDTVWTFDWLFETHTVNIYGEEHSFEEGTCTKCHIDQTFTKQDMLAGLNGKECIKLIDSTIIASGYADVLAAIDELGELSDIMYSTDDGEYWAFCDEDEVDYVIYIYGEEHDFSDGTCSECGASETGSAITLNDLIAAAQAYTGPCISITTDNFTATDKTTVLQFFTDNANAPWDTNCFSLEDSEVGQMWHFRIDGESIVDGYLNLMTKHYYDDGVCMVCGASESGGSTALTEDQVIAAVDAIGIENFYNEDEKVTYADVWCEVGDCFGDIIAVCKADSKFEFDASEAPVYKWTNGEQAVVVTMDADGNVVSVSDVFYFLEGAETVFLPVSTSPTSISAVTLNVSPITTKDDTINASVSDASMGSVIGVYVWWRNDDCVKVSIFLEAPEDSKFAEADVIKNAITASGTLIDTASVVIGNSYDEAYHFVSTSGDATAKYMSLELFLPVNIDSTNSFLGKEYKFEKMTVDGTDYVIGETVPVFEIELKESMFALTVDADGNVELTLMGSPLTGTALSLSGGTKLMILSEGYKPTALAVNDNKVTYSMEGITITFGPSSTGGHTHSWATAWSSDETGHWHACTATDCDIIDYSSCGEEGAAYGEHDFSTGTCACGITLTFADLQAAMEGNECIRLKDPDGKLTGDYDNVIAELNAMNITAVTFDPLTKYWHVCDGGEDLYEVSIGGEHLFMGSCMWCTYDPDAHVHSFSTEWSSNGVHHWHACTADGHDSNCLKTVRGRKIAHTFSNDVCTVCGKEKPEVPAGVSMDEAACTTHSETTHLYLTGETYQGFGGDCCTGFAYIQGGNAPFALGSVPMSDIPVSSIGELNDGWYYLDTEAGGYVLCDGHVPPTSIDAVTITIGAISSKTDTLTVTLGANMGTIKYKGIDEAHSSDNFAIVRVILEAPANSYYSDAAMDAATLNGNAIIGQTEIGNTYTEATHSVDTSGSDLVKYMQVDIWLPIAIDETNSFLNKSYAFEKLSAPGFEFVVGDPNPEGEGNLTEDSVTLTIDAEGNATYVFMGDSKDGKVYSLANGTVLALMIESDGLAFPFTVSTTNSKQITGVMDFMVTLVEVDPLAAAKAAAKAAIDAEVGTDTSTNVASAAQAAKDAIDACESQEAIDAAKTTGITNIQNAKLANAKTAAKAAITDEVDGDTNSNVTSAADGANTNIESATTLAAVETAKNNGIAAIQAAKLANAKAAAKAAIDAEVDGDTAPNVTAAATAANTNIDNATTVEAVEAAKAAGIAAIQAAKLANKMPDAEVKDMTQVDVPEANEIVNVTGDVKTNDLSADVSGLEAAAGVTAEEKASGAYVWMELTTVTSANASSKDTALIQNALPAGATIGTYLDIEVFKQIVGGEKTKVSETNAPVTITVTVPENLRGANRSFFIVYTHNGGAAKTIQPESYNAKTGVLTFKASQFSTYALAYTQSGNPKTGDTKTTVMWAGVMLVGLMAITAGAVIPGKKRYHGKYSK